MADFVSSSIFILNHKPSHTNGPVEYDEGTEPRVFVLPDAVTTCNCNVVLR